VNEESNDPKPSDDRNGCFLDRMWCCKVCDGEIPDGHTENCDIWKLEKKHQEFIAKEYNTLLTERDRLRVALLGAVEAIQTWHNMGMSAQQASSMWDIYWRNAPEMRPIREALKETSNGK
jgi:hypothetical protein